jgi:serine/threonine-protein kinase
MLLYCSQGHENPVNSRFCGECGQLLPLAIGQVIENRYRIVSHLGQGGFGRTFLAEDINRSNHNCVLKAFAPQNQQPEQLQKAKELFEREARVLHQLQHPQIPAFQAMLQTNLGGQIYLFLVQDYVEGDTYHHLLAARKRQGLSFSEVEVRQLLEQILPVLSYIHSLNVIHRDISPDNLMLRSSDQQPVLIDFGGVKQLSAIPGFWFNQIGLIRTRLGKKGYAPEEQLHQGKVFPNSDFYALAVTALVLLTGKEPQELYDSNKGTWLWGREISVSPQLEAVLKKMLAYKPGDRYQGADEVLQALSTTVLPSPSVSQIHTINLTKPQPDPSPSHSYQQGSTQVIAVGGANAGWLRQWALRVAGAGLAVVIGMNAWGLVNAVIHATHPMLPIASEKHLTAQLVHRRQALAIRPSFFNALVDAQFYAQHPDIQGRSLKNAPEDAKLRQEWDESAQELLDRLEQAELSSVARRKLGTYGQQDYEIWKEKANQGQLDGHTIDQLEKQVDEKFAQLFPQQQGEKLNLQTFGQIWYAIFADEVNKV